MDARARRAGLRYARAVFTGDAGFLARQVNDALAELAGQRADRPA